MKVRYRQRALSDLEEIDRFLKPRSPAGAHHVLRAIHAAIREVAQAPHSARQTSDPGIRVKVLGRYRYKIFYGIDDDFIEIIHIRHTSRRPWTGLI